jgi:hypothetical protein
MKYDGLQKTARNYVLVLGLAVATVVPATAEPNNANVKNDRNDNTTRVVEHDNDFDWGWLGLLGLAGLLPKKRQVEVQQFKDNRTDQTGQTGTGTGTTR